MGPGRCMTYGKSLLVVYATLSRPEVVEIPNLNRSITVVFLVDCIFVRWPSLY